MVVLMPYIEANDLSSRLDKLQGWQAPTNQPVVSTPCRLFRCPSDHPAAESNLCNYVGVAGAGPDAATLGGKDRRAGVFGYARTTKEEEVKDGTSNTLLFLETTAGLGPWAAGGPATVRGVDPGDDPPIAKGGAFGVVHSDTSWNWGGIRPLAHAALADGSVRALHPKVDAEVLAALATIAGGESLPAGW